MFSIRTAARMILFIAGERIYVIDDENKQFTGMAC